MLNLLNLYRDSSLSLKDRVITDADASYNTRSSAFKLSISKISIIKKC